MYYGWYGEIRNEPTWGAIDTNKNTTTRTARYPTKGAYSSHDPAVLDWQIDQAKSHGVTGFIVSWFGKAERWADDSLALLLARAELKNFKVAVYWETQRNTGALMLPFAVDDLSYVVEHYGKSKAFLKIDGRPVIFAYGRVAYQTPVALWPDIIKGVRERSGDFALIADGYQASYASLFDGLHTYDPAGLSPEIWNNLKPENLGDLRAWATQHYGNGVKLARQRNRIACVTVTPGCDARKAYNIKEQSDRLDGQTYRTLWEEAINANPDWVAITSWNEWPEGTEIEPSLELGDKYLQITAEYSKRFLNSATIHAPPPAALPKWIPGTTTNMDHIFLGRKVGVIMQDRMSDAEFWAAYCGARLQRLDWTDLIDPTLFNPSNFPVVIHIANEHFKSSVKVTDDVTRALIGYLHKGGFLVSLPVTGAWPLYYDQSKGDKPESITDKLGLGVTGAWDTPPTATPLTFYVNKSALSGLPPTAMFPSIGDVRFRPATRSRVPAYDYYLPLVQLWDDQKHLQGDAAAYIEHKSVILSPGKTLYVSQQTPGAFGSDEFYPSLYQFISKKLKPLPLEK